MGVLGISLGFYGYAFPGNINLMILELYNSKNHRLLFFSLGMVLRFESIYCIVSLMFISSLTVHSGFFNFIQSSSFILIFIMGLWMLLDKRKSENKTHRNTITRGILNIIIHPQQIPYWFIAGNLANGIFNFTQNKWSIVSFAFFNAAGTLIAMIVYMFIGGKIMNYFRLNIIHVNKVMGIIYIVLSLYNLYPF
jgi:small neutral amino acid transporter SnatA (MarC family)